jgi:hypothetical protein
MTPRRRPRAPLPRRVYWVRRFLVLGVFPLLVVGLVLGTARLLGAGGGGAQARPASAPADLATSSAPLPTPAATPSEGAASPRRHKERLAQPDGPCDDSDVVVTPDVPQAHAGAPVTIKLRLTTQTEEACTWEVSPDSVFVTVSGEHGILWSSQQCPRAVPTRAVVPRREKADTVAVVWDGHASDDRCSRFTDWVLPGALTVTAVAKGSVNPLEAAFVLQPAVRPTVTVTPTPTRSPRPTRSPSTSPSAH